MRAYVTSVGEKTTEICVEQLQRYGFNVTLLDNKEPWFEKYKKFIMLAKETGESCIHVDADVIVNERIKDCITSAQRTRTVKMAQFSLYDLYQNNSCLGQPVYYSAEALDIISRNFKKIDPLRPEATAWRLPEINKDTMNIHIICGIHGFFQDNETVLRAEQNKRNRKQISKYDFDLVDKLRSL